MEATVHKAKKHLSRRLQQPAMGEKVIIAKAEKPVAKLVAIKPTHRKLKLGSARGEFTVPDDFNDPLPKEIEDLFR
ncbi:MAG: type II toxin-antitoxin system Phd/YefM family antitoxin [Terriglobales bacterium]